MKTESPKRGLRCFHRSDDRRDRRVTPSDYPTGEVKAGFRNPISLRPLAVRPFVMVTFFLVALRLVEFCLTALTAARILALETVPGAGKDLITRVAINPSQKQKE